MEKIDLNMLWEEAKKNKDEERKRILEEVKRETEAEIKEAAKLVKEALEAKNFRINTCVYNNVTYREIIIEYEKHFEHLHPVLTGEIITELNKLGVCPDKIKFDFPTVYLYIQHDE